MKRNIIVSVLSGFFGSAMLLILLSATGIVGARSADIRSDGSRANEVSAATLLAGLGMPAPNEVPSTSAHFESATVERLLNPDGTLNLSAGGSGTLDLHGWDVTLDSKRGPIFTRAARRIRTAAETSPRSARTQRHS